MGGKWGSESRKEIQRLLPFFMVLAWVFLSSFIKALREG